MDDVFEITKMSGLLSLMQIFNTVHLLYNASKVDMHHTKTPPNFKVNKWDWMEGVFILDNAGIGFEMELTWMRMLKQGPADLGKPVQEK